MKDVSNNRMEIRSNPAKSFFAVLLSMMLFISMMLITAFAEDTGSSSTIEAKGGWGDLQNLIKNAQNGDTIVLQNDFEADLPEIDWDPVKAGQELTVGSGKEITIDLNGHIIDRMLNDTTYDIDSDVEGVFHVEGSLTITDSQDSGIIRGGCPPQAYFDGSGIKLKEAAGAFTVVNGGKLTIKGGTIKDCNGTAGAVWLDNGSFALEGGTITGTNGYSGTVVIGGNSTFNMSGGSINNNTVGGDVIKGFDAGNAAIYVKGGSFSMTGGSITGNNGRMSSSRSPYEPSSAVFIGDNGSFSVSGSPVIDNNGQFEDGSLLKEKNVYLSGSEDEGNGQKIIVAGSMTETANIGITMENAGVFTSGKDVKASDYAGCFNSDDKDLEVLTEGDELKLGNDIKIRSMRFRSSAVKKIAVGDDYTIVMSIDPLNATNKTLKWSSDAPEVLSVDDNGKVTGNEEGKATITVKTTDGSDLSRTRTITVTHKLEHTAAKQATCTEKGNIEYWTCSHCRKYFTDAEGKAEVSEDYIILEALGHEWGDWKETVEADEEARSCSRCGDTETRPIPKEPVDHEHIDYLTKVDGYAATCVSSGQKDYYRCSKCGKIFADKNGTETTWDQLRIPAKGHVEGEPVQEGEATEATCSLPGGYNLYIRCKNCGAVVRTERAEKPIDPKEHDWDEPEYTWSEDYSKVTAKRSCLNDVYKEHTEEETADVEETKTAATCEDPGKIIYTAKFKNSVFETQTYTQVTDQPLGHKWVAGEVKEPTCTEKGEKSFTCERDGCSETMTVELAQLPHKWEKREKTKEPTCTETGIMTLTCTRDAANPHTETVDIPALGHDWSEWSTVKAATEKEEGLKKRTCSRCKEEETEVIPKIGTKVISIKNAKVVLSAASFAYNGRVLKPSIKTVGGKALKSGTDYTVKWSNASSKNVGSYSVTITGKGKYTGVTKATYTINPKGTSLKKPKRAKKAITVKWKRQSAKMAKSRITGYQIQLATDKKFTKNRKTVNVKGYKKVSKKVKKLKGKKKYYIRIRTYKTVSGKNYYSAWSKVKTAKTR